MPWSSPALVGEELATSNAGWAGRYLNEAAHTLPPGIPADSVVTSGNIGAAIVREAVERGCDLIVMTTHGRSGFTCLRLGSVADQVLAHAGAAPAATRRYRRGCQLTV